MLRQKMTSLPIRAIRQGLTEFTSSARDFVSESGIADGLLTIFCRHTSGSLLIQEHASEAARRDLERYFDRVAPEGADYEHDDEGPDDMPAHIRSALTATQMSVPIKRGRLMLGTWQGIFLFEHRREPTEREIVLHLVGE